MRGTRAIGVLLLAACGGGAMAGGSGMGPLPSIEELQAVERWQVVQLPGVSVLPETEPPTLQFEANGRASGRSGCNQFGGGFERTAESLTFSQLISTKMACPGNRMDVEAAYLGALQATRSATLSDGALSLLAEDGSLLARLVPAGGT